MRMLWCWLLAAALWCVASQAEVLNLNALQSNAIKSPASASAPPPPLLQGKHPKSHPFFACAEDEDCEVEQFCPNSVRGGVHGAPGCLACRRRRKRCHRDAMCCPGNLCHNGICVPLEPDHLYHGEMEETIVENFDHGAAETHLKKTTSSSWLHHPKGQDGAVCLRSSDCAEGLCCARHFWSKICKPVLKEGQVCTKHRKKGAHGLEIFQRCHCGDGLTCRLQKDHTISNSSRLHTCQRH
nr:dickkopf-related protein 1 [Anolis sagrei ordinatus]